MPQSDGYKNTNRIDYLANFPGARREQDIVITEVAKGSIDVTNDAERALGKVSIIDLPEPIQTTLYNALASEGADSLLVDSNEALDVSAENVTVEQASTFNTQVQNTIPVESDSALDVTAKTVPTEIQNLIGLKDGQGNQVNPASESTLSSTLSREIANWTAGVLSVTDDGSLNVNDYTGSTIPTEQQSPVGVEDSGGNQVDPASEGTLSTLSAIVDALESNGNDKLVVDHPNVIDVASRDGRNLGYVEVRNVTDTVQTEDSDAAYLNAVTLSANGTVTASLSGQGSETLKGRVKSDGQYTVNLSWKDDNGNEIFNDEVASAVAGGTATELNETVISPNVDVVLTDGSGADATANGTIHLA